MNIARRETRAKKTKCAHMNGKKAFIAGPIHGIEHDQSYRETLKKILVECGYLILDPWQREKVLYSKINKQQLCYESTAAGFIRRDLRDIEECDVFVAYLPRLSAGTCMELFYAKQFNKMTIIILGFEDPSPWITFHVDFIFKKFDEFEKFMKNKIAKT